MTLLLKVNDGILERHDKSSFVPFFCERHPVEESFPPPKFISFQVDGVLNQAGALGSSSKNELDKTNGIQLKVAETIRFVKEMFFSILVCFGVDVPIICSLRGTDHRTAKPRPFLRTFGQFSQFAVHPKKQESVKKVNGPTEIASQKASFQLLHIKTVSAWTEDAYLI